MEKLFKKRIKMKTKKMKMKIKIKIKIITLLVLMSTIALHAMGSCPDSPDSVATHFLTNVSPKLSAAKQKALEAQTRKEEKEKSRFRQINEKEASKKQISVLNKLKSIAAEQTRKQESDLREAQEKLELLRIHEENMKQKQDVIANNAVIEAEEKEKKRKIKEERKKQKATKIAETIEKEEKRKKENEEQQALKTSSETSIVLLKSPSTQNQALMIQAVVTGIEAQYKLACRFEKGDGVEKNYKSAFDLCSNAALAGYAPAENMMGDFHQKGIGTAVNPNEAVFWYARAARNERAVQEGNKNPVLRKALADAQFSLASHFRYGNGVQKNEDRAINLYILSAGNGSIEAMSLLGTFYDSGECGKEEDWISASCWHKQAADLGHAHSQHSYAFYCENKEGHIKEKLSEAFHYYSMSAEQKNGNALYSVGSCYEKGIGVDVSLEKAANFYTQAVDVGCDFAYDALYNIGVLFYNGTDITKNLEIAFNAFLKISDKSAAASAHVARMYAYGLFVERDFSKAIFFYEKVITLGGKSLNYDLGFCYYNTQNYTKALEHLLISSNLENDSSAQNILGCMHRVGNGVDINPVLARFYFQQSVDKGNKEAQCNLAILHEDEGCLSEAVRLYKLSAARGVLAAINKLESEKIKDFLITQKQEFFADQNVADA